MIDFEITLDIGEWNAYYDKASINMEMIPSEIDEAMDYALEVATSLAKTLCPVKTGNLRDSIRHETTTPAQEYHFIADAKNEQGKGYAIYPEFGTIYQEWQPYMIPATDTIIPSFVNYFVPRVRELLSP